MVPEWFQNGSMAKLTTKRHIFKMVWKEGKEMKYNDLEVIEEFYSTAPDHSIGGLVIAKSKITGKIGFYIGNRNRCTDENGDIRYFLNFGTKLSLEYIKDIINRIEGKEVKE